LVDRDADADIGF